MWGFILTGKERLYRRQEALGHARIEYPAAESLGKMRDVTTV